MDPSVPLNLAHWLSDSLDWLSINEPMTEHIWSNLGIRLVILGLLIVGGIIFLVFYTNANQLWANVWADIRPFQDICLPAIIVALINIIELFINRKGLPHQTAHFLLEFVIVMTTYFSIVVYEFTRIERELMHDVDFWKDLSDSLDIIDQNLIGIHVTGVERMFEPVGLKYFLITIEKFKIAKLTNNNLSYHRVLLIHDCKNRKVNSTGIPNIKAKRDFLTKFEQQFKVYLQLHESHNIDLHFITQCELHCLLEGLKDKELSEGAKKKLKEICPDNISLKSGCKKMQREQLDCLILNGKAYPTTPSTSKGLEFQQDPALTEIMAKLSDTLIGGTYSASKS